MTRAADRLGITLLFLLGSLSASAAPVLPLTPHQAPASLVPALEAFEDASRTMTVEQVELRADSELPRLDPEQLNVGYRRSAFWLRFRLMNTGREAGHWLLELPRPNDEAVLYTRSQDERFEGRRFGKMLPLSQREVSSERPLLHLSLEPGESKLYWMRVAGEDTLDLAPTLWTDEALAADSAHANLINGVYFGVLLAMLLFNAFLFLSTRDRTYFFYSLFQLGMVLTQAALDQITFWYLWPESPHWAARSEILFASIMLFGALGFARCFLELGAVAPWLDRLLAALMGLATGLGAVATQTSHRLVQQSGMVLVVLGAASILFTAVLAWRRGSPHAQLFLWGWVALLCGTFASGFAANGLLVTSATASLMPRVGSLVEATLLSFGLAQRIRALRREHKRAQDELLEERTAQAHVLEVRVEERTRELLQALEQLKSAQARMVQQARLASLGHLVAGVAHEVGNPLNFTRGGAQDLERRLELLEGMLGKPEAQQPELQGARKALEGAKRALKLILTGNERIHRIVENLRNYVTARSVAPEPTDLAADLEATLSLVGKRLDDRGIRVHRELQPLPKVPCRPGELNQVFTNLLLNSAQAMPHGGEIFITGRCADGQVEFLFRDTGPGIAPEHREAIFDPFFTTLAPSEGTGLGLSISHEIVTRHGGELRLVNGDGGATFSLTLPLETHEPFP
ncbi:sensor histidine kinase [Hyalangium versicolor]|uniref:sensor histidine kinase n=1 Tax=Hyalangium versicolor TaxID=2861190 RepID=UPI001CCA6269|nr:7TM diverse intracellular signaling domain-containing protein [Hyalangium versicolor]